MKKKFIKALFFILLAFSIGVPAPTYAQPAGEDRFLCGFKVWSNLDPDLVLETVTKLLPWVEYGRGSEYECDVSGFPRSVDANGTTHIYPPENCAAVPNDNAHVWCYGAPLNYECDASFWGNLRCDSRASSPPPQEGEQESQAPDLDYIPLEPIPGLNIEGGSADFSTLITGWFRILLVIGALLAVATLVIGGVGYMLSEAVHSTELAKKRIQAALFGLLLLVMAWLILNTINPQLVLFGPEGGNPPPESQQTQNPGAGNGGAGGAGGGGNVITILPGASYTTHTEDSDITAEIEGSAEFANAGFDEIVDISGVEVVTIPATEITAQGLPVDLEVLNEIRERICTERRGSFGIQAINNLVATYCAQREGTPVLPPEEIPGAAPQLTATLPPETPFTLTEIRPATLSQATSLTTTVATPVTPSSGPAVVIPPGIRLTAPAGTQGTLDGAPQIRLATATPVPLPSGIAASTPSGGSTLIPQSTPLSLPGALPVILPTGTRFTPPAGTRLTVPQATPVTTPAGEPVTLQQGVQVTPPQATPLTTAVQAPAVLPQPSQGTLSEATPAPVTATPPSPIAYPLGGTGNAPQIDALYAAFPQGKCLQSGTAEERQRGCVLIGGHVLAIPGLPAGHIVLWIPATFHSTPEAGQSIQTFMEICQTRLLGEMWFPNIHYPLNNHGESVDSWAYLCRSN